MDLVVGSLETITIDVAPYDGSTAASLNLYSPASATPTAVPLGPGVATVVDGQTVLRFTSLTPVQYTVSGWWVLAGAVTGVGATPVDRRFFVAPQPVASGPDWTPTLTRVANYVPSRTLPVDDTTGTPQQTFDDTTRPTADEVTGLIEDAVAWVVAKTSANIDTSLFDSARAAASLRTAGWVEVTWPIRPDDINVGQTLLTQADAMLTALAARNDVAIGQDPEVFEVLPVWSFPCPEPWADNSFLY